jgi:hypothetical protein
MRERLSYDITHIAAAGELPSASWSTAAGS